MATHTTSSPFRDRRRFGAGCFRLIIAYRTGFIAVLAGVIALMPTLACASEPLGLGLELPTPSGEYAIGTVSFRLVDGARKERDAGDSALHDREMMVRVWYPAAPPLDALTVEYMDEPTFVSMTSTPEMSIDPLARYLVGTHSVEGAPMPAGQDRYPVLVFAPGAGLSYLAFQSLLEDLASCGYIVVAVNSPGAAGCVVFPDGHVRRYVVPDSADDPELEALSRLVTADLSFVVRNLGRLDRDRTLPVAGRMQFWRVGCFGHSIGGAASLDVAGETPQVVASANLDGMFWTATYRAPIRKPSLMVRAEMSNDERYLECIDTFWANLRRGGARITIGAAAHGSFTDWPLLLAAYENLLLGALPSMPDPLRPLLISRDTLRRFFEPILRDSSAPELVDLEAIYADLAIEQQSIRKADRR